MSLGWGARGSSHCLVFSPAPTGQARWSLRLLAGRMVELGYVEHVSHETVRKTLKKT